MVYIAKIYKIVNTINDDIYVGSTKNELRVRWQGHKTDSKRKNNGLYDMMNEHPIECFRIVLIEEVECKNKEEQIQHEQRFIDELKPKLNKNNAYQICAHNMKRWNCKDCGGSQICAHNMKRWNCKDCGGSQICAHNRQRSKCKECGGGHICNHNRQRSRCKECGGGHICNHNRQRSRCKECGGSDVILIYCKECNIEMRKYSLANHKKSKRHIDNTTREHNNSATPGNTLYQ